MAAFVSILVGSDSDLPLMEVTYEVLSSLQISFEKRVLSAHRTPEATQQYVRSAEERGCAVFICAAGLAAHLAGFVAAHTLKPVIGVPLDRGPLQGVDALLATVQMPGGIPVACVAIGKAGAQNAAYLSAHILALNDPLLTKRLASARRVKAEALLAQNVAFSS